MNLLCKYSDVTMLIIANKDASFIVVFSKPMVLRSAVAPFRLEESRLTYFPNSYSAVIISSLGRCNFSFFFCLSSMKRKILVSSFRRRSGDMRSLWKFFFRRKNVLQVKFLMRRFSSCCIIFFGKMRLLTFQGHFSGEENVLRA